MCSGSDTQVEEFRDVMSAGLQPPRFQSQHHGFGGPARGIHFSNNNFPSLASGNNFSATLGRPLGGPFATTAGGRGAGGNGVNGLTMTTGGGGAGFLGEFGLEGVGRNFMMTNSKTKLRKTGFANNLKIPSHKLLLNR